MENRQREVILLKDLELLRFLPQVPGIDMTEEDEDEFESIEFYLGCEGGIWDQDDNQYFERVHENVTYRDMEKSYEQNTDVFKRLSDGKFFSWSYLSSPYRGIDDRSAGKLTQVFPVTQTVEITTYE